MVGGKSALGQLAWKTKNQEPMLGSWFLVLGAWLLVAGASFPGLELR